MIDGTDGNFYYRIAMNGDISEPPVVRMINSLLNEFDSPTFVDIGAHIGYYTIYVGNLVGGRGSVVAIEPNKRYFATLKKNIEINGIEGRTKAYNMALSDKIGKANMGGEGGRYFTQSDTGNVEVISFDELCENENIKPDIVKIDVYGAEVNVLLGMTKTLSRYVKHMFLETHRTDLMHGFDIYDVLKILKDYNLEVFEITDFREEHGGKLVPVSNDTFRDFKEYYDRMLYIRRA
ncbi:MAG: FkbM family methyltransferase [Deltaproteobacteria bacterium]